MPVFEVTLRVEYHTKRLIQAESEDEAYEQAVDAEEDRTMVVGSASVYNCREVKRSEVEEC